MPSQRRGGLSEREYKAKLSKEAPETLRRPSRSMFHDVKETGKSGGQNYKSALKKYRTRGEWATEAPQKKALLKKTPIYRSGFNSSGKRIDFSDPKTKRGIITSID